MPDILEFTNFQDTIMFHKRGRFGVEKVQNNEIHVKVVLDEYFLGAYNFEKLIRNEESSTLENTRKLFYVACSRKKKDLVIIRVIKPEEEAELLSYFNKDKCLI